MGKKKWVGCKKVTTYVLFSSDVSPKPVGLFKFKIRISADKNDGEIVDRKNVVELISYFYEYEEIPTVCHSTCVGLGPTELMIIPNEFDLKDKHRPPDYKGFNTMIYDTITNKLSPTNSPQAPKIKPLAALVDGKVYVFSCCNSAQRQISLPYFESFDPVTRTWEPQTEPSFYHKRYWYPTGYAVVGKFILVCFLNPQIEPRNSVFSYNTISKAWKRVHESPMAKKVPDPSLHIGDEGYVYEDDDSNERIWDGEAVVIGNVIYAYVDTFERLLSYTCSEAADEGYDLSLEKPVYMEGYEPHCWAHIKYSNTVYDSGIIGKIDDELICVIHTSYQRFDKHPGYQPIHVEIVRIYGPTCCKIIKSLMLYLQNGDDFYRATLSSCITLQPKMVSYMEHGERDPKKPTVSSKGADDGLTSKVEMMAVS